MTDDFPRPLGLDDQPGDTDPDRLDEDQDDDVLDPGLLPNVITAEDYERRDVDDPDKPGIDDYTD